MYTDESLSLDDVQAPGRDLTASATRQTDDASPSRRGRRRRRCRAWLHTNLFHARAGRRLGAWTEAAAAGLTATVAGERDEKHTLFLSGSFVADRKDLLQAIAASGIKSALTSCLV